MKFPVTIRHRSSKAKVYAPGKNFAYYRLCYTAAGKRRMQTFPNYSEARQAGERIWRFEPAFCRKFAPFQSIASFSLASRAQSQEKTLPRATPRR